MTVHPLPGACPDPCDSSDQCLSLLDQLCSLAPGSEWRALPHLSRPHTPQPYGPSVTMFSDPDFLAVNKGNHS